MFIWKYTALGESLMTNIAVSFVLCYICHLILTSSCIYPTNWQQCFKQCVVDLTTDTSKCYIKTFMHATYIEQFNLHNKYPVSTTNWDKCSSKFVILLNTHMRVPTRIHICTYPKLQLIVFYQEYIIKSREVLKTVKVFHLKNLPNTVCACMNKPLNTYL